MLQAKFEGVICWYYFIVTTVAFLFCALTCDVSFITLKRLMMDSNTKNNSAAKDKTVESIKVQLLAYTSCKDAEW